MQSGANDEIQASKKCKLFNGLLNRKHASSNLIRFARFNRIRPLQRLILPFDCKKICSLAAIRLHLALTG